ncbi:MAG: XdhC family protein [Planctomycetes bacterium]|nr:XdhC family protein [Planctomycetota bacterium]
MRELLAKLELAIDSGRPCVYCAVVETRGSTPQKAGAAMLVFPDGTQVGTLGGGCVEAEVKRQALRSLDGDGSSADRPNQAGVFTFNLDDNYGWDDGLICGGRMTILADPVITSTGNGRVPSTAYFKKLRELMGQGQGATEAVVIGSDAGAPVGSRYLFDAAGTIVDQRASLPAPEGVRHNLAPLSERPRPYWRHGVAYLPVFPRVTLFVVGGGHVGQAVAKLAAEVDFDIWALDDRDAFASVERFPSAKRLLVGDIGQRLREMTPEVTPSVYALIVTRGHAHDEEALYHLATTPAGYVGMIGSKRKIRLIYEDLLARGISQEALDRVHAPLGFAIGSQTVPEIAISIVAELIAVRNLGKTIPAARERSNSARSSTCASSR